jgi:ATP:ADP antiporter, AAA family
MKDENKSEFGPLRSFFWPIHRSELQKFLPLMLIGFFTALNYFILKVLKDTLLITARGSDADITSLVKLWGILPGALFLTFLFTRLRNYFSKEKVIYIILASFLLFFLCFTFLIFPNRDYLHPTEFCIWLINTLPPSLSGLNRIIIMFQYWTYSLFYVLAELWGSIGLTVLFWGFANDISKVFEAKRFYGPLGIGTNFAGVAGGSITAFLCSGQMRSYLPYGNTPWEQSLISLTFLIVLSGIAILFLYRWMHVNVLSQKRFAPPEEEESIFPGKKKKRLSLRESFSHVLQNKYLLYIGIMVLALNIENHLVEVLWKSQVRELYPGKVDFARYMSYTQVGIGFAAMLASLLLTGNVIRKFGWTISALLPPIVVLLVGGVFFISYFAKQTIDVEQILLFGMTPLALVAFLGTLHNILTRAFRYSLFDATKELAFTPLSPDSKVKGKAAIDGVGSRFGKSAGAGMIQGLRFIFPASLAASAPSMAGIVCFISVGWIYSVLALGKRFNAITKDNSKDESDFNYLEQNSSSKNNSKETVEKVIEDGVKQRV